ncbi:DUF3108 domain-containing protein [Salinimicrobium sp. GXAS 041]|uniref:DUF3108 domain-containing protein n=1 Tax=Salinimicrobium sp. GXAS 041 TaxID=3400806 RepID=UPI003C731DF6
MKKIVTVVLLLLTYVGSAQSHQAFQDGEWFRFRIHYGILDAGYATLEVNESKYKNNPVYHVVGTGKSAGAVHWFFKVKDNYESYFNKYSGAPYKFIRQIDEGGHTRDIVIDFDHKDKEALVFDRKRNTEKRYPVKDDVHDMLSAFYYLRNNLDVEDLQEGDVMDLNMFFDDENFDFQLRFLGREVIDSKIGKITALKFRPYVMAGRVFKEKESLTIWVSDDENRMPIKIKAKLAVGSLDADIDAFKGLKHPLRIIMD